MKKEESKRFRRGMEKLQITLPSPIRLTERQESLRIDEFWEALHDYSIEAFERAVERAKTEFRFFPVISDMIDLCNQEEDTRRIELKQDVLLLEGPKMTKEEAMERLQMIFERLPYGSLTDEEIAKDKEKVQERKKFLREQASLLLQGKGPEVGKG